MFADLVYFDCGTVRVFAPDSFLLLLFCVIYAQLWNCCIKSARRHAAPHVQGMPCHMLGPCMEIWHPAKFRLPDNLNRSSSQHFYLWYRGIIWYVRVCVVLWHHSVPESGGNRHWLHCHSRPEYDVSAPSAYARSKSVENCMCYNDNADVSSLSAIRRERCWHGS